MSSRQKQLYEFGRFSLDVSNGLLLRDGEPVPLHPKAFDTLLLLVEHRGEVLGKDDLMRALWPDSFVEESNLSQNIYVLRKTLGQEAGGPEFIKTVPKRGYRFVGEVRESGGDVDLILEEQITSRVTIEEQVEREGKGEGAEAEHSPWVARQSGGRTRPRWKSKTLLLVAFAVVLAGGALLVNRFVKRDGSGNGTRRDTVQPVEPFHKMKITRLTDIGKAHCPAISSDGKYLAYVLREDPGGQSIWVKHIPTGSATSIVLPVEGVALEGLVFSKDGSFVYYDHNEKGVMRLYQVPVLGGPPRKIIENVWGRVGISPDGGRLAFLRTNWNQGEHALLVAAADGTGERVLTTRKTPDYFNVFGTGPEWSPDGRLVAVSGGSTADGGYDDVIEVRVEDGAQRRISGRKWRSVGQVAWLSDASGLLIAARERDSPAQQVWLLSYPSGEVRRVTNDLNYYERLGLTSDAGLLVAENSEHISNIWIAPTAGDAAAQETKGGFAVNASRAAQITTGRSGRDGFYGIAWTPDGKIVYSSNAGKGYELWITDRDGSGRRQLTVGGGGASYPSVSPDGRYVVFSSDRAGERNIWRVDIDGRNPVRLTDGRNELHSSFTPDGRWIFYGSGDDVMHLWKVPVEGGAPVRLTDKYSLGSPVVSPDGKLIAVSYYDNQTEPPWRLGVITSVGGEIVKSFPQPFRSFRWTLDSQSLTYISGTSSVSNIWSRSLGGSPPVQLTDFNEKRIYWFDWSRDGKQLALARGDSNYDVVLISDFR